MQIQDVENLAELGKIELSESEKATLLNDLEGILGYVKQIAEVDLSAVAGVPETEMEYSHQNIWREDLPASGGCDFSVELITSQYPDSQDGFVKVKKIL